MEEHEVGWLIRRSRIPRRVECDVMPTSVIRRKVSMHHVQSCSHTLPNTGDSSFATLSPCLPSLCACLVLLRLPTQLYISHSHSHSHSPSSCCLPAPPPCRDLGAVLSPQIRRPCWVHWRCPRRCLLCCEQAPRVSIRLDLGYTCVVCWRRLYYGV